MIDAFIHAAAIADEQLLLNLKDFPWNPWLDDTRRMLDARNVERAGVCIMDASILHRPHDLSILQHAIRTDRLWFYIVPNIAIDNAQIMSASRAGFRGVIFHSYLQRIDRAHYSRVIDLAHAGVDCGMVPGFCTAYGSTAMYRYESLPLVAAFAEQCSAQTILYHMGGARILEALLLCEAWGQLILETSFSLPYWIGSSIETDTAFAIRKLGAHRVMFGSDYPFIPMDTAIREHGDFFTRHSFEAADRNMILDGTARSIFLT